MLGPASLINGFRPEECLILDTDTTGIKSDDEILHISGEDGFGRCVLNLWFKPEHKTSWPDSLAFHHITPQMVSRCGALSNIATRMKFLLKQYKCIIGWGIKFDIRMLKQSGIDLSSLTTLDVMELYSKASGIQRPKLYDAADWYGYTYDSSQGLGNVDATRTVLEGLMRDNRC